MRPVELLHSVSRDYPDVWRMYDQFLASRGEQGFKWPPWCHCPMAGAYAVVSGGGSNRVPPERRIDIARVAAIAAWRPTQGVYRFDPDLLAALWETPITGQLPTDHLLRLPEWCVYVELTNRADAHGFFAHLEHDSNDGRTELRILLDCDEGLLPLALHLGGTMTQAIDGFIAESAIRAHSHGATMHAPVSFAESLQDLAAPLVSILLYLCASDAELRPVRGRGKLTPRLKSGRTGPHMPAAKKPEVWEAGFELGAQLREATRAEHQGGSVRPHVRRAHWHGYWTGSGENKRLRLNWVSPVLVGGGPSKPTVRGVD